MTITEKIEEKRLASGLEFDELRVALKLTHPRFMAIVAGDVPVNRAVAIGLSEEIGGSIDSWMEFNKKQ